MKIRFATKNDIEKIIAIGLGTNDFLVNNSIRFYEFGEISRWIDERENSLFILAEEHDKILGFVFCKIMSNRWAMIDNFYVVKDSRNTGVGTGLMSFLERELRIRDIDYVNTLVKPSNDMLISFLQSNGYVLRDQYIWLDRLMA